MVRKYFPITELPDLEDQRIFCAISWDISLVQKFDEAHGATLSAVWGSWARYVYHLDEARFANYGRKVWNMDEENDEKNGCGSD